MSSLAATVLDRVVDRFTPPAPVPAELDLQTMTCGQVSRFLLQRASFWNFRSISLAKKQDLDDPLSLALYMSSLGDLLASAGHDRKARRETESFLRRVGASDEALEYARDYVTEMSRTALERVSLNTREERRFWAAEFLQLALHARQEVAVHLFLATRLAALSGMDWAGLVKLHGESRSDYEKEIIAFLGDQGGKAPFDRYFDHAMFNANHGTYTGKTADALIAADLTATPSAFFTTASEEGVLSGALYRHARRLWETMGRPARFDCVEMGAGMGKLAESILDAVDALPSEDPFRRAVTYTIVEKSPALARIQSERLGRFGERAKVLCRSAIFGPLPRVASGLFLSNELVDMFPPRKVVNVAGRNFEAYLGYRGGLIVETLGPVREETEAFLTGRTIALNPGETYYVQPDIDRWIGALASSLERGQIVTVDYGERRRTLRANRHEYGASMFRGYLARKDPLNALRLPSLQTYRNAPTGVGRAKDMTVDVDFSTIEEAAIGHGLTVAGFLTQRDFVERAGGDPGPASGYDGFRVSILSKDLSL